MPVNRESGPPIQPIREVSFPQLDHYELDNGLPVIEINKGDQDIVQVEVINTAGRLYETHALAGRVCAAILKDGASGRTGQQIAEQVDYYGASLSSSSNLDVARANLFTLTRYQDEVLPYLASIWLDPDLPAAEFDKYKNSRKQKLREDLSKPDTVSYRRITEKIFGLDHPYGYNSTANRYDQLQVAHVQEHYDRAYGSSNAHIIVTGKVKDSTRQLINRHLGQYRKDIAEPVYTPPHPYEGDRTEYISLGSEHQSSIKIGKHLFTRTHPDYAGMFILNVILGGYFGSRLMSSIREEKGYTYNVYSSMGTYRHDGFFYISTEVDHEYLKPTLDEIYLQLAILRSDLVGDKELQMVKNYIMGHLLSMLDGPFQIAQMVKTFVIHDLEADHIHRLKEKVLSITAKEIRDLAVRYLDPKTMIEVVVGR